MSSAVISECGSYRYRLYRDVPNPGPGGTLLWIMLNPSTADATKDDPTIRKVVGFTSRLGMSRVAVGNLLAYRATAPTALTRVVNQVGPRNAEHLAEMLEECSAVVLAWGANGQRWPFVSRAIRSLVEGPAGHGKPKLTLGTCRGGDPKHPLMVSYDAVDDVLDQLGRQTRPVYAR